jgi:hypothetical protein
MLAELSDVSQEVWKTAAERLTGIGAFADEEHKLPDLTVLRKTLAEVEAAVRVEGYKGGRLEVGPIDRPREGVDFLIFDHQHHGNIRAAEAAWNGDYGNRQHEIVDKSVRDWIDRLTKLKTMMKGWLPTDMSIVDRLPTPMNEERMKSFDVPPAQMPTFEVHRGVARIMRVQPKGLWIIGANGRVDLTTAKASYILVDKSEPLSGAPDWHYYASANGRQSTPLDMAHFKSFLI